MVRGLTHQVERFLNVAVLTEPLVLAGFRVASHPDQVEPYHDLLLEHLETVASLLEHQSEGVLAELPGLPFTRFVKRQIEQQGSGEQRQKLRDILARVARVSRGKPGRPREPLEERSDVRLARAVDSIQERIEPDFKKVREQQRASRGRYLDQEPIRTELKEKGHEAFDIDTLLSSRTQTPHAAAVKLAAHYLSMSQRTVAAAVSRGRRLLRRADTSR